MLVTSWVNRADGTVQWQPGMEVHVKHMKRKDVPAWAIPDSGKEGKEEARTPADPKAAAAANERAASESPPHACSATTMSIDGIGEWPWDVVLGLGHPSCDCARCATQWR